jgi:outer membrane protein OmpA-like peptidoglycan-associated protein
VTVAPELSVRLPLTDVSSAAQWKPWKVTQARLTVGLYFGIAPSKEQPKPEQLAAPTVAVTPSVGRLRLEEVRLTEYVPLLPYVFFAENAAQPRAEYAFQASKAEFAPERLPMDALAVNRSLLDIVGKRLRDEYPTARLVVTGTTDGRQEAGNSELPRQRAEWVKQYLVTTWGISPERITVQARRYPEKPSASRSTVPEDRRDGDEENRRVELSVTIPDVLAPLPLTAENQRYAQPDVLAWDVRVEGGAPIASWELVVSQAGETIEVLRGQGVPESPIRWRVPAAKLRAGELPLEYVFRVTDTQGRTAQTVGSLPVDYLSSFRKRSERLPDRTVTRFSLVLFDFDSDALTPENQRVLEQLVLPFVQATSVVRIAGYTDRIGERGYNQDLSLRRARRVREFLAARVPGARYEITGYGESVSLYDNDTPIGRQLCRTVQITIETPSSAP